MFSGSKRKYFIPWIGRSAKRTTDMFWGKYHEWKLEEGLTKETNNGQELFS